VTSDEWKSAEVQGVVYACPALHGLVCALIGVVVGLDCWDDKMVKRWGRGVGGALSAAPPSPPTFPSSPEPSVNRARADNMRQALLC
jgi:hypothetical protein